MCSHTYLTSSQNVQHQDSTSGFFGQVQQAAQVSKSVLHNIYHTLLNDGTSAFCSAEAQADEHVARAVVNLDDPEIVLDLRRMNGKAQSSLFDALWSELQAYLDDINLAVDESRHGKTLHMPFAISLQHLQEVISD